jgi:hypothetical protein
VHLAFQQQADRDRRQCPRQAVGGEHRKDDREAERGEQIFRRPLQEDHRGDIYPKKRQGQAMAYWGMAIMIGPIIGPVLGGWLTITTAGDGYFTSMSRSAFSHFSE